MEDQNKNIMKEGDKEIVFSKTVKAGKRIYYLDVKKNRKEEMFLAITESKKVVSGEGNDSSVSFEKHKIFLYQEDFEHFISGLEEAVNFVNAEQPHVEPRQDYHRTNDENETSPNLDFDIDLNIEDIKLAEK